MTKNHVRYTAIFVAVLAALCIVAVAMDAVLVAGALLAGGILVALLMAVAWMRPRGYPTEHHPPFDRMLDDTRP